MRNILHAAAVVVAATVFLLPPVVNASSLSSSVPVIPAPAEPTDPDEERPGAEVVEAVETALVKAGHEIDPTLTAIAQALADDWTGEVRLDHFKSDLMKAGYRQAKARSYIGPNGLEHHIEQWQEGHKDLDQIRGKNVGMAFSTEQDSKSMDQLWIVWADEAA